MALRDIDEKGRVRIVSTLDYELDFNRQWHRISAEERSAIEVEINRRLNELLSSPNPNWGSIMNTSIEGGRSNAHTGVRGDWSDTAFDAIYRVCGENQQQAALLFGTVWEKVIIERAEPWIGIRSDPTFPQRGITLEVKTYFPDRTERR